ncbi:MAG: sulfurtransferase complex subunit TusD [Acidiferrobacteraceae bacterium]|jgi:tRNA 2-thiouridine synthesizing protein D|nr:sulfurtransferase complex subunit TusD [Acidiferrobacteraceae bacterium]MDP6434723.1 sulfurtransferase complex subunit TusD [Arenicellales bacterium]MDP6671446.1 sulfurtransferase complex subunit TusD [Arenicellales bacterium]MDP6724354.1 sulfurtransferase complex subunit TusD [Arenicellales bacterium]|tara:strand:- start:30548 stop:30940 length:393 start_codon:yes stop_codon:yes gene_type:complete
MKFSIQVNEGPYTHQASDTAYNFTRAALEGGHEIYRVFFYHDGVNNGTRMTTPPQDDRNIVNRWSELSKEYDLDLVLCVAAAQRRGIVDEDEAKRHGKSGDNVAEGFRISGLGQLIDAGINSDRLISFGD